MAVKYITKFRWRKLETPPKRKERLGADGRWRRYITDRTKLWSAVPEGICDKHAADQIMFEFYGPETTARHLDDPMGKSVMIYNDAGHITGMKLDYSKDPTSPKDSAPPLDTPVNNPDVSPPSAPPVKGVSAAPHVTESGGNTSDGALSPWEELAVAAQGRVSSYKAMIDWVAGNTLIPIQRIDVKAIPSPSAVAMLQWVKSGGEDSFWRNTFTKVAGTAVSKRDDDDNSNLRSLLERGRKAVRKSQQPDVAPITDEDGKIDVAAVAAAMAITESEHIELSDEEPLPFDPPRRNSEYNGAADDADHPEPSVYIGGEKSGEWSHDRK
jgi:hypothetical protein